MNTLKNNTVTIIGAGNIGQILIKRLLENNFPKEQLSITDSNLEKQNAIAAQSGVKALPLTDQSVWGAKMILTAASPNAVPQIVGTLSPTLKAGQILVSFAAAISLHWLEALVPDGVAVARIMPNAPSLVGQGCNPVVFGDSFATKEQALVQELLALLGETITVTDEQMNWCVGLTGAAMRSLLPAIEGMTGAGIEAGLNPAEARKIAAQITFGTAALVQQTDLSFEQIKTLTPMQTVDETELIQIFHSAAHQAQAKVSKFQKKIEENRE